MASRLSPQRPQSSQRKAEVSFSVVSVRSVVDLFFAADEEVDGLSPRGRKTGFTGSPPIVYDMRDRWLGPVAQLGARMTGSHEVGSSNLPRSTN